MAVAERRWRFENAYGSVGDAGRRRDHLQAVQTAALTLAEPVPANPDAVATLLGTIAQCAVNALDGCSGWLMLMEDPAWRDLAPGTGPEDGYIALTAAGEIRRWPVRADGLMAHVLTTGEPVYVTDARRSGPFGSFPRRTEHGVRSFAAVPLRVGERLLGTLDVGFAEPRTQRDEDWEALRVFAAHAAAALERVRLSAEEVERVRLEGVLLAARSAQYELSTQLARTMG
ncbi:MAG: GAF domain-containing protein, partial [Chloroflexota bacterium]